VLKISTVFLFLKFPNDGGNNTVAIPGGSMINSNNKYYTITIYFVTKEERDDFRNYLLNRKAKGIAYYRTINEMLIAHKKMFKDNIDEN